MGGVGVRTTRHAPPPPHPPTRSFLGGQLLSALVGVTTRLAIPLPWVASPVAMALSLSAMQLTCARG